MFDVRRVLARLRGRFDKDAEQAYAERDAADPDSYGEAFADGKAHAYGQASDEIREAQSEDERG